MGCNQSHTLVFASKDTTPDELDKPLEGGLRDAELTGNNLSDDSPLAKNGSTLYDASAGFAGLIQHLVEMGHVLADVRVRPLFYRYLREGIWIEEIFNEMNLQAEKSKKNLMRRLSGGEVSSVKFNQYSLLPRAFHGRSYSQQEEMASGVMYLLKRLKLREAVESTDFDISHDTILHHFSEDAILSLLIATALPTFLVCAEYKKMLASNWMIDADKVQFSRSNSAHNKIHNPHPVANQSGGTTRGHFHSLISKPAPPPIDPYKATKDLYKEMLGHLKQDSFHTLLSATSWLSPLIDTIDQFPLAISVAARDKSFDRWVFEYVNQAFTNLTGYSAEEAVGSEPKPLLQCEQSDSGQRHKMKVSLKRHEACKVAIVNQRRDGSQFLNFLALQPVFERGISRLTHRPTSSPPSPQSKKSLRYSAPAPTDNGQIETETPKDPLSLTLSQSNEDTSTHTVHITNPPSEKLPIYHRSLHPHGYRPCNRYISMQYDIDAPAAQIQDLKLIDDLMELLVHIL